MPPVEVLPEGSERGPAAAPARSSRRATARRASARRASARSHQSDIEGRILGFLAHHPKSTVGDLARSLNLEPDHVGPCLTQLTSTGEIHKAADGYSALPPDRLTPPGVTSNLPAASRSEARPR